MHYQRRQTLKNCERFITPELKSIEVGRYQNGETVFYSWFGIFVGAVARPAAYFSLFNDKGPTHNLRTYIEELCHDSLTVMMNGENTFQ